MPQIHIGHTRHIGHYANNFGGKLILLILFYFFEYELWKGQKKRNGGLMLYHFIIVKEPNQL
jgi:hypothetical protein